MTICNNLQLILETSTWILLKLGIQKDSKFNISAFEGPKWCIQPLAWPGDDARLPQLEMWNRIICWFAEILDVTDE